MRSAGPLDHPATLQGGGREINILQGEGHGPRRALDRAVSLSYARKTGEGGRTIYHAGA